MWSVKFFTTAALLGAGLAMDAFSVSTANGLNEPKMKAGRMYLIAGTFAFFQFAMPMAGWFCVHEILNLFRKFQPFIPWIALLLLLYIGGKMLIEGIRNKDETGEETATAKLSAGALIIQGIATSIDALSVGFTIAELNALQAFVESVIIAIVTFFICVGGVTIGKKFGTRFSNKASVLGGVILIGIGIWIFVSNKLGI